ncbi:DUF2321 domain-containing protein [Chloroflexota bacterium]
MSDFYEVAQICVNGHVITDSLNSNPEVGRDFCEDCGSPTIMECEYCESSIRGYHHIEGVIGFFPDFKRPSFCPDCGKPYPWTESKIIAAHELAEEMENLSSEDRELLSKSIDDLIVDSPRTELAATRFKKLLLKIGEPAAIALRNLVIDIASETAKKLVLGG